MKRTSDANKVLQHPDLEIGRMKGENGNDLFVGRSKKYEPYEASAETALDCFFKFNIQLSEQKLIVSHLKS